MTKKKVKETYPKLTDEQIQAFILKEATDLRTKKYAIRRSKFLHKYDCCFFCSSKKDIELHHIFPDKDDWRVKWYGSDQRISNELKKCVPLCYECHKKLHDMYRLAPAKHGTAYAYYAYDCRCNECKKAKRDAVKHERRKMKDLQPRIEALNILQNISDHVVHHVDENGNTIINEEGIKELSEKIIFESSTKKSNMNKGSTKCQQRNK